MYPFRRLTVWQKAHALSLRVYGMARAIGWREYPSLASQMQRAAFSISFNIAEGSARASQRQFAHFVQIALGSAHELDCQLLLARDLNALEPSEHARLEARVHEVSRMLTGLRKRLLNAEQSAVDRQDW